MSVRLAQIEESDRSFTVVAEQEIPATAEEFDRVIGRPGGVGEWFGLEFTWPTSADEQMDVGSALEFTVPVGPVKSDFIMIVADRVAGESLLLRTTRGVVDCTVGYAWKPVDGGIHVCMTMNVRVRGALWWRCPWSRMLSRRKVRRGMEAMREQFETAQTQVQPAAAPEAVAARSRQEAASARPRPAAAHRASTGRATARRARPHHV